MNVLFVEDDVVQRHFVKSLIESEFPVVNLICCGTLAEAEKLVDSCDVVVLDIGLPDADHEKVFEWITSCDKPLVVYTASTEPETIFEAVRAGALNIICKGSPASQMVVGMYVAIAEYRMQCDETARRTDLARRLQGIIETSCDRFKDSFCKNKSSVD